MEPNAVEIAEVRSTIKVVDDDSFLRRDVFDEILRAVMQAVDARLAKAERVRAEQRISRGVSYELEEPR